HGADHPLPARILAASLRAAQQEPADDGRDRIAVGASGAAPPLMEYVVVKWIHVLSSTLLFGAGVGSAFHLFTATLGRDVAGVAQCTRNVVLADWLFTL